MEAQARIDHEIAELNQAICKLQAQIKTLSTQRNTLSPVSRLPPEILSSIFIHYAVMHHESATEATCKVPDWVNVSYVCRHWRDVALKCPTLWTYVFAASQSWTEELLSRSQTAPLRIRLEWTRSKSWKIDHLEQVLAHAERIQELQLAIPFSDHERVFSMFSSPAPLLRSLVLHVQPYGRLPRIWPFFDYAIPTLRRLKLVWCSLPQPTPILHGLTTLILQSSPRLTMLTMVELKTLLYSTQRLVHLELLGALDLVDTELGTHSFDRSESFRSPHLSRLAIEERSFNVIKLLSWLDFSSQTEVRILGYELFPAAWATFRSLLVKRFFTSGDNPPSYVHTLAIDVKPMTNVVFSASKSNSHGSGFFNRDWNCNIPLKISISRPLKRHIIRDILRDARRGGFLAGLRSAHLTIDMGDGVGGDSSTLEDIHGLIPELRSITIRSSTNMGSMFSFLSFIPHYRAKDRDQNTFHGQCSGAMLTIALEELVIENSVFDHRATEPDQYTGRVSNLYEALAIRKEKGYHLNRLTLIKCYNVLEEDVVKLKDVVAEVVWDGFEDSVVFGDSVDSMEESEGEDSVEDSGSADEGEGEYESEDDDAHGIPEDEN